MTINKTVLITGASRGIGRAAAFAFAKAGYSLIITCLNSRQELTDLAAEIEQNYQVVCLPSVGDIGDIVYVESLFSEIQDRFDHLDILVNNAGISHVGLLQEMDIFQWNQIMQTNLTSCFLCSKFAIPLMLQKHSGSILNVSSVWGSTGASAEAAYSASKGGVNALTKALAKELAPSGIRVNAIAFGAIDTQMNDLLTSEEKAILMQDIPLGRLGTSKEAGHLILDIAANHPYLTGQIVTMDGGWL